MAKTLNKEAVSKFLKMDFRNDPERHEPDWYLEKVPESFYEEATTTPSLLDDLTNDAKGEIVVSNFHHYTMNNGFYCKPTWEWIRPMAEHLKGKKVLDVMAGNGLVSLCLKHCGVDIDACDRDKGTKNNYSRFTCFDYPISPGEDFIVEQAKHAIVYDTVLLIWPPYIGDGSDKVICDNFLKSNPDGEIIFIGENVGGCTGSDEFFENYHLEPLQGVDEYYIPDWGIYDGIYRAIKY